MPVSHQDHCRVTMPVPIASGGFDQFFNLGPGEVLSAAKLAVWLPSRGNCSFFDGWRDQLQARFGHGFSPSLLLYCSYNTHFTSSVRGNLAMMVSGFYRLSVVIRSADAMDPWHRLSVSRDRKS